MMRRSSSGGRRGASCALGRSHGDAIICSIREARTSPVRTGSSSVRPRAARASELTDNVTAFAESWRRRPSCRRSGHWRLSLCELPVKRLLLDRVPEGVALLPQGGRSSSAARMALSSCRSADAKRIAVPQTAAATSRHVVIAAARSTRLFGLI